MRNKGLPNLFTRFAKNVSMTTGKPVAFIVSVLVIIGWAVLGPLFHFSDTWQLVINTATTIITFLMVFLIQNTQNRDSEATQIKLDELIRSIEGAHNSLLCLDELTQEDLDRIRKRYLRLAQEARRKMKKGLKESGRPKV
jgi:low affinity Fe/Cu permease